MPGSETEQKESIQNFTATKSYFWQDSWISLVSSHRNDKGTAFVTDKSFWRMMYFGSSVDSYRWSVAKYRQYCTAI